MKNLFKFLAIAPLLAACSDDGSRNSITYSAAYTPPRRYESSVLNEPDTSGKNDWAGRKYRVNGSGYGPNRDHTKATPESNQDAKDPYPAKAKH